MLMTRILPIGLAAVLVAALLPQGSPSAEAAKAGARKAEVRTSNPGMKNLKGRTRVQRDAEPKSLAGTRKRKGVGLLLPAVQKIREAAGGGSGGGGDNPKPPKPPEDCMSCAN
jgi:hypothetical protein